MPGEKPRGENPAQKGDKQPKYKVEERNGIVYSASVKNGGKGQTGKHRHFRFHAGTKQR